MFVFLLAEYSQCIDKIVLRHSPFQGIPFTGSFLQCLTVSCHRFLQVFCPLLQFSEIRKCGA